MIASATEAQAWGAEEQFELILEGEDLREVENARGPVHTAGRIHTHDRGKYDILVRALEGGASLTGLSRSHKVGTHTLYAIIAKHWGSLDSYHAEMAIKCKNVARLGLDKMAELIPGCKSLSEVAIATGVVMDKAMALQGTPGLVIRHEHVDLTQKANSLLEDMKRAMVLDVGDSTPVPEIGMGVGSLVMQEVSVSSGKDSRGTAGSGSEWVTAAPAQLAELDAYA